MKSIIDHICPVHKLGGVYTVSDLEPGSIIVWKHSFTTYEAALKSNYNKWVIVDKFEGTGTVTGVTLSLTKIGWCSLYTKVFYCGHEYPTKQVLTNSNVFAIYHGYRK